EEPQSIGPTLDEVEAAGSGLRVATDLETADRTLSHLESTARPLRREGAAWQLAQNPGFVGRLSRLAEALAEVERDRSAHLTAAGASVQTAVVERWNSLTVRLRDLVWLLEEDILGSGNRVLELVGQAAVGCRPLFHHGWKLVAVLSSLGRLEVRGRDSLGLSIMVTFDRPGSVQRWIEENRDAVARRVAVRDFVDGSLLVAGSTVVFTYKVAQEVGALGDNVARLFADIRGDALFLGVLSRPDVASNVFGHTRWASNGIINEPNCHPVNQETLSAAGPGRPVRRGPEVAVLGSDPAREDHWISAALNGDIDNYQELRARFEQETGRTISPAITTDTKIIPVMIDLHYRQCGDLKEAFRRAVGEFEGSLAIAMHSSLAPDKLFLALRGSGQSLCVGLTDDGFMVASELYGAVELTDRFVRMDGTRELAPGRPETRGQLFVLDATRPAGLEGIEALALTGETITLTDAEVKRSEITTRDINRAGFEHYLLKEIDESPRSVERTLAGKFRLDAGARKVDWLLGDGTIPGRVAEALRQGRIREIMLIGQGTAAIAGDAIACTMRSVLGSGTIGVLATKASELSGYHMADDLSGTLVIAVSQSGTTTDTNRTVDLVRSRGASVIGIVNRRISDLVYKVDGVLYTSDGRDVEMSVASTKAFYSQVVAGYVIALYLAHTLETMPERAVADALGELARLPDLMRTVLAGRGRVEMLARGNATSRRDWAVVGSGAGRAAAAEIRIKLSELCYKSIATDTIEDKKHIDLSSEPLVLVCAAGLPPVALKDAIKEVSIFKSHKSRSIVICSADAEGFEPYAAGILRVPEASESVSVLLSTLVGHLWGYYSARSIDEGASALRRIRAHTVRLSNPDEDDVSAADRRASLEGAVQEMLAELRAGRCNSSLSADTSSVLTLLFQHVLGRLPLSRFAEDFGELPTRARLYETVVSHLTRAIQELSRPIDAIKHQAKTVTVGISREEEKLEGCLFDGLCEAGVSLDSISYKDLTVLRALTPAIERVDGTVRYGLTGLGELGEPTDRTRIEVRVKTGIARTIPSRVESNPALTGTKRWVVSQRSAYVGEGHADRRLIAIVPLAAKGVCDELVLLHLVYRDELSLTDKRTLIHRTHDRYEELRAMVTESNVSWRDEHLDPFSPRELVTVPVEELAHRIVAMVQKG
ncbi:MAG: SIS domain-containing protein, partial [Candidatus Riflebacteria bacterium]|nr:SIS domain-containing protein [Candidatus Riflebacteria bacterium]